LAVATWVCVHAAGLHATVAGVALGLLVRARPDPGEPEAPATRLERRLSPLCAAVVLPAFALSATGVSLAPSALLHVATDPISRGVAVGLVAGKLLGVPTGAWLAVRLGIARLPDGVRWRHLVPLGLLAGIGYTVSLLLARLALPDPAAVEGASTAILTASAAASALALVCLRRHPIDGAILIGARTPGVATSSQPASLGRSGSAGVPSPARTRSQK
ncbi:Na+/H+ antiporter NhaA, partial [Frankia torreyi]